MTSLSVAVLLFAVTALSLWKATLSDDVPCQYPCYPSPPGSTGTSTAPPSGVITGYPPPSGGVYPAPTGYYPYNYPPPYGGFSSAPPPPDHILPYFPFYYLKPVHGSPDEQSDSSVAARSGGASLACLVSLLSVVLVNSGRFV